MRSKAYRSAMSEANAGNRIATQVRLLRETAGLTQTQMAKKLGTRQSAIARMEDTEYGKFSVAQLHRIAKLFDVALWVEFAPFSAVLQRTGDLSPGKLTPLPYDKEFDETGEPLPHVPLAFDGSAIALDHYVTKVGGAISQAWFPAPGTKALEK
ncbi:helix-turn-helix domain-containing protein [Paraburkholderia sp. GAS42]|uniref:helix-turn-helix domain-containing protein n=1 Tax=Paraburkholderia sp. GAS42 TaxID=3035135 RepID=UPI003D24B607